MRGDHGVVARDFHCPDAVEDALPGRPQLHLADQGEKKLIFAVGALLWSRARSGRFTHGDLAFECGRKGRCGEGKREIGEVRKGLSGESPLFPSPIFPPRTKEQRPGGGDGALQRKEEDTVSVRRRMTLPLNEQTQLGTCETVRWNRSFKVVEALVYVNGFADYCFP